MYCKYVNVVFAISRPPFPLFFFRLAYILSESIQYGPNISNLEVANQANSQPQRLASKRSYQLYLRRLFLPPLSFKTPSWKARKRRCQTLGERTKSLKPLRSVMKSKIWNVSLVGSSMLNLKKLLTAMSTNQISQSTHLFAHVFQRNPGMHRPDASRPVAPMRKQARLVGGRSYWILWMMFHVSCVTNMNDNWWIQFSQRSDSGVFLYTMWHNVTWTCQGICGYALSRSRTWTYTRFQRFGGWLMLIWCESIWTNNNT